MMTGDRVQKKGPFGTVFSRALHVYFRLMRGMTLGVRAIVHSNDGSVLLVRHTYTPGWHFPGGGVEIGETCVEALRKELREEAGLTLAGEPKLKAVYHNKTTSSRDHVLLYLCNVVESEAIMKPNLEIADAQFFSLDNLPEDIESGTLARIREHTEGLAPSPNW